MGTSLFAPTLNRMNACLKKTARKLSRTFRSIHRRGRKLGVNASIGRIAQELRTGSIAIRFVGVTSLIASGFAPQALAQDTSESTDSSALEEIIVRARAQTLYRVPDSDTGKLVTAPLDSSQLITSINAQLIEDQGARDAQDIYRNISGVTLFSYAGVTARGFRQEEIFFDGLRGDPYIGFNVPQLFNIERVDFLKGPAGMLYGPGAPGGLFNYVTKKPDANAANRIRVVGGNRSRVGGSVELNGGLGDTGAAWRAAVFREERDTPRFNSGDEVGIYDFGVSVPLPGETNLVLQATRYEQDLDANRLRGVPVTDEGVFIGNRNWNHNEATDFLNLESTVYQALFDGSIGDKLTWDFKVRYNESEQEQNYHEPRGLFQIENFTGGTPDGIPDLVSRQWRDQFREEEQISVGTNWVWSQDFGSFKNRLLAGYEYFDGELTFVSGFANPSNAMIERFLNGTSLPSDIIPLRITDPQYGLTNPANYNTTFFPAGVSEQQRQGAYLLNEATFGKLILVGGVRFDDYEDTSGDSSFSDNETTFRAGAVYKVTDEISLYAQWADSYTPQSIGNQRPEAGGIFEPTTGQMIEAGIKTELMGGRIQTSAAVYEIIRENILQSDPRGDPEGDGVDNFVAFGEVTSQGFEFDVSADVTDDWVVTGSYAYNDTKITDDNGGGGFSNSVGDRFANAPRHQAGFWTRYQFPSSDGESITALALGGDYIDERLSLSGQTVKPYAVFDASVIWESGPIEVLARVENLFDRTFAASGFISRTGHFPGDPRTFFVEFYYTWNK
ncbi:MAG: TonB-dependent receptor [Pseudomonadota bacterium]